VCICKRAPVGVMFGSLECLFVWSNMCERVCAGVSTHQRERAYVYVRVCVCVYVCVCM